MEMIELKVKGRGLLYDPLNLSVYLFLEEKELDTGKMLTLKIDQVTAQGIRSALCKTKNSRPLTHELFEKGIKALGAAVDRIEITAAEDGVYIGNLVLIDKNNKEINLDSRPSDGIALVIISGGKILVARELFEQASQFIGQELEDELDGLKT